MYDTYQNIQKLVHYMRDIRKGQEGNTHISTLRPSVTIYRQAHLNI